MGTTLRSFALAIAIASLPAVAGRAAATDREWSDWRYLVGRWIGVGGGHPGQATAGEFRFEPELGGRILVRRSFAEYAAAPGRPASRHEDLILLYRETPGGEARALYLDNEGHVIHYEAVADTAAGTFVFTSVPNPRLPRYRFSYRALTADSLAFRFEIAPPGRRDSLTAYVSGTARRAR
ncbi:MAG TPA: hypothetical protein VMS88_05500 [Terriglobales bacterium]|nr:hypothetical protein [Terriglobales bacterium]